MGTSNISGLGNVFVQNQVSGVKTGTQDEDLQVAFTEVMSQMATMVGGGFESNEQTFDVSEDVSTVNAVPDSSYDRYEKHGVKISEANEANRVENNQVTEELEEFADDVSDVIQEELGVTEDQIEEAMEALGLNITDLLNPTNLAALVAELTGVEDMGALLCNSEFMTIMQNVGEFGQNLLQELGVTIEELTQIVESMVDVANVEAVMTEEVAVDVNMSAGSDVPVSEDAQALKEVADDTLVELPDDTLVELPDDTLVELPDETLGKSAEETVVKSTDENVAKLADEVEVETTDMGETIDEKLNVNEKVQETDNTEDEQTIDVAVEDDITVTENNTDKESAFSGNENTANQDVQTRGDITASVSQNVTEVTYAQTESSVSTMASQVDVTEIIKQIVEYSKVTLSQTATTMEMQLNPENLGKIYLEISSKDGIVSAHITAQNEAVKEALEGQLVEFKQNLNQAGVKVEAVEVTVGNHEFERNLEQNAQHEQRKAEEQEKTARQTRHINLNDLDELQGMMSEEETLVAQMMAEQGNSVDFTA